MLHVDIIHFDFTYFECCTEVVKTFSINPGEYHGSEDLQPRSPSPPPPFSVRCQSLSPALWLIFLYPCFSMVAPANRNCFPLVLLANSEPVSAINQCRLSPGLGIPDMFTYLFHTLLKRMITALMSGQWDRVHHYARCWRHLTTSPCPMLSRGEGFNSC